MEEVKTKRETALLIPYKIVNGTIFVFLQKRNKDSKILPDHFSFFGGKLEPGEGKEEALKREIQEELNFELKEYSFLNTYDSFEGGSIILNVHFTKVSDDFDETVTVSEGQYGKFLSEDEVANEKMIIDHDKIILNDLFNLLKKNNE